MPDAPLRSLRTNGFIFVPVTGARHPYRQLGSTTVGVTFEVFEPDAWLTNDFGDAGVDRTPNHQKVWTVDLATTTTSGFVFGAPASFEVCSKSPHASRMTDRS